MGKTLFRLLERTNRRVYPAFHRKSRHSAFANRLVHENNLLQSSAHRHWVFDDGSMIIICFKMLQKISNCDSTK